MEKKLNNNSEQLWLLTGYIALLRRLYVSPNTEANKTQYRQACYDAKNDKKYDVISSEIDKMVLGSLKYYELSKLEN